VSSKSSPRRNNPIPFASVTYDANAHAITLTPRGALPLEALRLSIDAALILDSRGRPIDGNRDGQAGGSFIATLRKP
jgi:hypothetical protein